MSFEKKVVNFEIKQNMDWIMTGGDDILYLINTQEPGDTPSYRIMLLWGVFLGQGF